jgi:hypothetical protein
MDGTSKYSIKYSRAMCQLWTKAHFEDHLHHHHQGNDNSPHDEGGDGLRNGGLLFTTDMLPEKILSSSVAVKASSLTSKHVWLSLLIYPSIYKCALSEV